MASVARINIRLIWTAKGMLVLDIVLEIVSGCEVLLGLIFYQCCIILLCFCAHRDRFVGVLSGH